MTLNPQVYSLGVLSAVLLVLSIWIFVRYQRTPSIVYYSGFLLGLSSIALVSAMIYLPLSEQTYLLVTRIGYVAGVLTFSMLLMFSWYFPIPSKDIPKNDFLFWVVPLSFFIPFSLLGSTFIQDVERTPAGLREISGGGYWVFPLIVVVFYILAVRNLVKKVSYTQGSQQRALWLFTWALVITALIGVIADVIIPATRGGIRTPIGIYGAGILFGISAYIVAKK